MRLRITHTTTYRYEPAATGVIQGLRMTPCSHDGQYVAEWQIDVSADTRLDMHYDAFGNVTHVLTMGPTADLTITAEGLIDTTDTGGVLKGTDERFPPQLFLRSSDLTEPAAPIVTLARQLRADAGDDVIAFLHALMMRINEHMTFDDDPTHSGTTAAEAFALRRGVCQDYAHIFIAGARAGGVPARFVSGHFLRADGVVRQQAGHAWAEAHVPSLGWVGFDPTNRCMVTQNFVKVGVGRDYRDVPPNKGVYRGIGLATFIENSMSSSATYGQGGASIASQDACTIRLMPTGGITVATSLTEFGQGAHAVAAQVAATTVGVSVESVRVIMGDTETTPYGGGNWGSRGTGIGGEAVFQTGKALKANILNFVARLTESEASLLDIQDGRVVDRATGAVRMTLEEVARTAYFRTELVPKDYQPELTVTRSFAQKHYSGIFTNGIHASYLEVDPQTGFVKLLKHWVIDDAGTVVNPLLVDEQIRGGVVQGIGAALYEQCLYSDEGQFLNGTLAEYLTPMAGEMPDIVVTHTHLDHSPAAATKTVRLSAVKRTPCG